MLSKRSSRLFNILYLFVAAFLAAGILAAFVSPKETLVLYPQKGVAAHLFSDSAEPQGASAVSWVDRTSTFYECRIAYGLPSPYCGIVIKYKNPRSKNYDFPDYFEFGDGRAIDLSGYDGLQISYEYSGKNKVLRFYMRNSKVLPRSDAEYDRVPYLITDFEIKGNTAYIDFGQIEVAQWWINRFNPPEDLRRPKFDSVFELGVNFPSEPVEGVHRIKLREILAVKSVISRTALVAWIALSVAAGLLLFAAQTYLRRKGQMHGDEGVDRELNCPNRTGVKAAAERTFPVETPNMYVMAVGLGCAARTDKVLETEALKKCAAAIAKELRSSDLFGRWERAEFVIISRINRDNLDSLIVRLVSSVQSSAGDGATQVSMKIGVTEAKTGESFDDARERAEQALVLAQQSERATWELL